ncbi:hypothetical protein MFIFM68171_02131 [Madurella fahalii]|uniref:Heterokaryon incompatibility domain-containing protein n=1 Tax=Madurella fahalii TaxID=1157608 RepID=A0ABQ0G2G3_9PEZI
MALTAVPTRPLYRYSPLPAGAIRLLHLMPHGGNRGAPIQCRLVDYSLEGPNEDDTQHHLYEALSYVWGLGNQHACNHYNRHYISIEEHCSFPVTTNLHAALQRLRSRQLVRVVWVDAICINQADDREKGEQVRRMAEIYSNANRVIVWLGEADGGGDQALEERCSNGAGSSAYRCSRRWLRLERYSSSALLRELVRHLLGDRVAITTGDDVEIAVIKGQASVLAVIESVELTGRNGNDNNMQRVALRLRGGWKTTWMLPPLARRVQPGDLVCLLSGAARPSILRHCRDYLAVVMITAPALPPPTPVAEHILQEAVRGHVEALGPEDVRLLATKD